MVTTSKLSSLNPKLRHLLQVRERHKAKGFEVETVGAKIQQLMEAGDVEEEEDQFPLVAIPDSQVRVNYSLLVNNSLLVGSCSAPRCAK